MFGMGRLSAGAILPSPKKAGARTPAAAVFDLTSMGGSSDYFNQDLVKEAVNMSEMGDDKASSKDLMDVYKQLTRSLVQGRITFGQNRDDEADQKSRLAN